MDEKDLYNLPEDFQSKLMNFFDNNEQTGEKSSTASLLSELKKIHENYSEKSYHAVGGMKKISKVQDLRAVRQVALAEIKENKQGGEEVERFLREARITAALEHPNIVPIYEIGINQWDKPYFTMKFLKDQSLQKILHELAKMNPKYTSKYPLNILLEIFLKVCDAVAFAHSCGVAHLDLKPNNIMIGDYGEVYVCDWGLAKIVSSADEKEETSVKFDADLLNDITLSGVVKGTPGYMAPEQINSQLAEKNEQTDIYALGAILYNILLQKKPLSGLDVKKIMNCTVKGKIPDPKTIKESIPESLNAITVKAMEVKQSNRYDSVNEMVTDIRAYQQGFATEAENANFVKALWLLIKRHRMLSAMLILLVFTALTMGIKIKINETRALQALELYRQEKIEKERQTLETASYQVKSLREKLNVYPPKRILERLDDIIALKPDFNEAIELKALVLFISLKFDESFTTARKLTRIKWPLINDLERRAFRMQKKNGFLTADDIIKLVTANNFFVHQPTVTKQLLASYFKSLNSKPEKEHFLLKSLALYKALTDKNWAAEFKENDYFPTKHKAVNDISGGRRISGNHLVGWCFSPKADIVVTHLGTYDIKNDGILGNLQIRIYDITNDKVIITNTLTNTSTSEIDGGYKCYFSKIAKPVTLLKGINYAITSVASREWLYDTSYEKADVITITKGIYKLDTDNFVKSAAELNLESAPYFGPNLKFEALFKPNLDGNLYKIKIYGANENCHIDLSGNLDLKELKGIEFFEFETLDLSQSGIESIDKNLNIHVKTLVLTGCKNLKEIKGLLDLSNLEKVTLPMIWQNDETINSLTRKKVKVNFN